MTKFTSERQPDPSKRKRRGRSQRNKMLDALKSCAISEEDFYKKMVTRSLDDADPQSATLMKEVFSRLYPNYKSTLPIYDFEFPVGAKPSEKVNALEQAVANGHIPADIASTMVSIIKSGMDISKVTDLEDKIAELEKMIGNG